jgi:hypothetical protein
MKKSRARKVNYSDPRSYNVNLFWIFFLVAAAFIGLVVLMVL